MEFFSPLSSSNPFCYYLLITYELEGLDSVWSHAEFQPPRVHKELK